LVCGSRTKVDVSGRGFAKYCREHFHTPKKGKATHNKKNVDVDYIKHLYVDQQKSMIEISREIKSISNVTVKKKLVEAGVPIRPHSENQSIHNSKSGIFSHDYEKSWWETQYKTKSSAEISDELECSPSLVLQRLKRHGIPTITFTKDTTPEKVIIDILDDIGIPYEKKKRGILSNNRELDFYIPSKQIAIEVDGIYWHSSAAGKTQHYHVDKTNQCEQLGIQLLHFWDQEVINKRPLIASMIRAKIGATDRFYARKCAVADVPTSVSVAFFNQNHMQGYTPAARTVGLYYNDKLVCAGSFSRPRFNKKFDWELIRFATVVDTTVVGGLSRIISNIEGTLLSYANRRWSSGAAYRACGFNCVGTTKPTYYYTRDFRTIESRMKYQKHLLVRSGHDGSLTESQIMERLGYAKIWDCGQLVFVRMPKPF